MSDDTEHLREVRPQQAFRWDCLDCGRENFDRAKKVEFEDPEDEDTVRAALGLDDEEGTIVTMPDTVTCLGCLSMFRLED